ncbi:restriction endonuclease subunit S [Cereibacter changlensis]|uniref:Restriction endonuclease subunit S n=1 Tax=Cereibacter changlensis TaxID=402884 RepID=A0A4V5NM11_9RHOB|nr:restriction endonuclease subunit S [Cereibacter changlensis]TKA97717.1 restriction endonuclease subunit S [Cereibacter changlensis]
MTRQVYLEEVASLTVGHVGSMADEYVAAGVPFLRSLNVLPHLIDMKDVKYISRDFHKKLKKSALRPGDVVVVRTGKPGTCAVIPANLAEANCSDLVIARCGPELRPHFLSYWVNSIASDHVLSHTVGAVQQHFNVGAAKRMPILLPPLKEQDDVVAILGALDDKIELNRKAAATLEEMSRALYRSWFVDFDPVHARADGRPPAHMDSATAALFPDTFDEDGLPAGWSTQPYPSLIEIISGGTPKTSEPSFWDGDVPWYSVVDAPPSGQIFVHATEKSITVKGLSQSPARLVPRGTTIVSARGTVGKLAITPVEMTFNQSCYGLRGRHQPLEAFTFFATQYVVDQLRSMAHGSVFATITRQTFEGVELPDPGQEALVAFEDQVEPWLRRIDRLGQENRTLATLRDTLLPRLMSGEFRVGAAREMIEDAA